MTAGKLWQYSRDEYHTVLPDSRLGTCFLILFLSAALKRSCTSDSKRLTVLLFVLRGASRNTAALSMSSFGHYFCETPCEKFSIHVEVQSFSDGCTKQVYFMSGVLKAKLLKLVEVATSFLTLQH